MAYSTINMLTTRSFISPCAPTTHPLGCPVSPSVAPTPDSDTCKTAYSSTRTSQKLWSYNQLRVVRAVCVCGRRPSIGSRQYEGRYWKSCSIDIFRSTSTSRRWRDRATITQRPSDTFGTCWLRNLHRRWLVVWSCQGLTTATLCSMKMLQRVQNNTARIVLQDPRRSHATPLLRKLHWLPVQQRINYKVALLTFKVSSTSTPLYLRRLIKEREHVHNLRSATTSLSQPSPRTTFAKRAFCCTAPAIWKSLPKTVTDSDSITVFKSRLKTFRFSQAYSLPFSYSH